MSNLWQSIHVRPFKSHDIAEHINYWHDPDNTFLEAFGLDRSRLPPANKMQEQLEYVLEHMPKQCTLLTIELNGTAIGVHEITDIEQNQQAVMHANLWFQTHRGKGIGKVAYVKAMDWYFEHFHLEKIIFKTPINNVGANKLKQFLGLQRQAECTYSLPIFGAPIEAYFYEVSKSHFYACKPTYIEKLSERAYDVMHS